MNEQMQNKSKWALPFERMVVGSASEYSGVMEFSFHKCNAYYVNRWHIAERSTSTNATPTIFSKSSSSLTLSP